MGKRLFATSDRNESHTRLEEVLASGDHPSAHCREDPNDSDGLCYSVWSDTSDREPPSGPLPSRDQLGPVSERDRMALDEKLGILREPEPQKLSDDDVDRIAQRIAKLMNPNGEVK